MSEHCSHATCAHDLLSEDDLQVVCEEESKGVIDYALKDEAVAHANPGTKTQWTDPKRTAL